MEKIRLKKPRSHSVAVQCREMGLKIDDTILGREESSGNWHEVKLTLLFIGRTEAVWKVSRRNSCNPRWKFERESCGWDLRYRVWYLVGCV